MKKQSFKVTIYPSAGQWRWRLQSANNRIIGASSEAFKERRKALANCRQATGFALLVPYVPGRLVIWVRRP